MTRSVITLSLEIIFMNILLSLILYLNVVTGQGVVTKYGVQGVLAGKTCSDAVFIIGETSAVQCVVLCRQHAGCKSVFYNRGAKICTGCDVIYTGGGVTSWHDGTGTEYFGQYAAHGEICSNSEKPCTETHNVCLSSLGVCVCDPATNYDPGTGSCMPGCTTLGSTFQRYPGWKVSGYNIGSLGNVHDVNICLQNCRNMTTCYVVDYHAGSKKCYYNSASARTAPSAWDPDNSFDAYVRNCA